jgi:hypothetical protein
VIYGDSLTWESQHYVARFATVNGVDVTQHSWVGNAICDYTSDMWSRLPHERPTVVVLAFYGNSWTPCMRDGHGGWYKGAAIARKYEHDAEAAIAIARESGSKVVFVGAPRSREQMSDAGWERVRDVYRRLAKRHRGQVFFFDSSSRIAPRDAFTETQPCSPRERTMVEADGYHPCVHGRIIVRSPDGLHFCPRGLANAAGQVGECPRYSSGGWRYMSTLVEAARDVAARARRSPLAQIR